METLDKHFRALTKAAFAKHGFASADLLSHWPEIVGADNAAFCTPERIIWPRSNASVTPADKHLEKPAGTLILNAAAGRALDVQYKTEHLLECINGYLGYHAIAKIKVHANTAPQPARTPPSRPPLEPSTILDHLEDPALKEALARLNAGILSDKSRSPQGK
jgi:hypothetical protein